VWILWLVTHFNVQTEEEFDALRLKELKNGRLAMVSNYSITQQ
jgi:Chlorophyll A-B binding protein